MLGTVHVESVEVSQDIILSSACGGVHAYWDEVRADRFAPPWTEFELILLPPKSIPYTHIVDIDHSEFDISYRFWGTGLIDILGGDRTGYSLLHTKMGVLAENRRLQILNDYRKVLETREPQFFLWDAASAKGGGRSMVIPSLRLPLSNDGETVDHKLTTFDFSGRRNEWERLFEYDFRATGD